MVLSMDVSSALQQLESLKKTIDDSDDAKLQMNTTDDLNLIINLLQDPVFRSIVQVQDSLSELNTQIGQHPSILPGDFDVTQHGDWIINVPPNSADLYDNDYGQDEQRVPRSPNISSSGQSGSGHTPTKNNNSLSGPIGSVSDQILAVESQQQQQQQQQQMMKAKQQRDLDMDAQLSRPQSVISNGGDSTTTTTTNNTTMKQQLQTDLMASEWAQVQSIELVNDGTGLGFGIIGARTAGVIVKTILPGGVADRDSRLQSGDHILQIGDVNLHEMVSEQVASVLRQSGTHVRLVVARPVDPMHVVQAIEGTAIVPSRLLLDPIELERYLIAGGYPEIFGNNSTPSTPQSGGDHPFRFTQNDSDDCPLPETERFVVELTKDANGLGITIAGYVCEKEELSGIFVKSVSPGSAADISGRIQVNDRIIEVDNQSLQGYSNHQAVEVLKKSGQVVTLCLERYLRGPKYEQLQQAIAANEMKPSTPMTPPHLPLQGRPYDGFSMKTSDLLDRTAHDEAMLANRKLILARDSLESRLAKKDKEFDTADDLFAQESAVDDDEDDHVVRNRGALMPMTAETANMEVLRHKYYVEPVLTDEMEAVIRSKWQAVLGPDVQVIVAQIRKFSPTSGLGISLEGTVDVEGGVEVRPHHYIRSILPEGPVGKNGLLRSADELLEVNGQRLLGMDHLQVVDILKELPQDVRMVCGREQPEMVPFSEESICNALGIDMSAAAESSMLPTNERLVKAKSDGSLATGTGTGSNEDNFMKMKSRSLEPLTGLAMWSSEPQIIELLKGERGLGFSILDYQDPLDSNDTLIVIRSLVPGGVAQLDGRLIPGDRLLFVNDINLENASLDQAVQALKGAPRGVVRIGVAKPLPMADTSAMPLDRTSGVRSSMEGGGAGNNQSYIVDKILNSSSSSSGRGNSTGKRDSRSDWEKK